MVGKIDSTNELKRGLLWFGSATLVMRLLDVGATLVLLRVLTREEMGIAALSWSVVVICEAFNGLGVGTALVQASDVARRETNSLFWFATGVGVLLAGLMTSAASFIADFYGEPALTWMVVASAMKLIFVGIALVPLQLLSRELRFREASIVQTGATALEAVTKIALALYGAGAWALVLSNSLRGLYALAVVSKVAPYRPTLHFRLADVRRFLAVGLGSMVSGVILTSYRNVDYLLIGRYLGVDALGIYRVAFSIAMTPVEIAVNVVNRVAFPVYARIASDRQALVRAFARSLRYVLLILVPSTVLLFAGSESVLTLVAHERWLPAAPAIRILCWAALLRGASQLFPALFQAAGRPTYLIYDSLLSLVTLTGGFWVGLKIGGQRDGMMNVCIAWLAAYPVLLSSQLYWAKRSVGVGAQAIARATVPILGGLLAMLLATWPISIGLSASLGRLELLAALAVVGLITYGLYLRVVLKMRLANLHARSLHDEIPSALK